MNIRNAIADGSAWFVKQYRFTFLLLLAVVLAGTAAYTTLLDREGFPSVDVPFVLVQTPYFVDDVDLVLSDVTEPYEVAFADVADVASVSSTTSANFSTVVVEFDPEISSMDGAKALREAALASGIDTTLETEFRTIDASKVDGENDIVFTISSDASLEIIEEKAREVVTELENSVYILEASISEPFSTETNPITGEQRIERSSFSRVGITENDELKFYEAISIGVIRQGNQDDLTFSQNLRSEIESLQEKEVLTEEFDVLYGGDFAASLQDQIGSLESNALSGLFAVVVILFFFVSWRASVVTSIFIPVVLTGSFFGLYLLGYSLNVISLFSLILVLGLFVDDAIVVVEAIDSAKNKGKKGIAALKSAISEVGVADISGTLTTILVFAPMLFISGILGDFIRLIPITVILSLVISLIVALSIIPFVSSVIIRKVKNEFLDSLMAAVFFIVTVTGYIYLAGFENPEILSLQAIAIFIGVVLINSLLSFVVNIKNEESQSIFSVLKSGLRWSIYGPAYLMEQLALAAESFFLMLFSSTKNAAISSFFLILIAGSLVGFGLFSAAQLDFAVFAPAKDADQISINLSFDTGTNVTSAIESSKLFEEKLRNSAGEYIDTLSYFESDESGATIAVNLVPMEDRSVTAIELGERIDELATELEGVSVKANANTAGPPTDEFPFAMQIYSEDTETLRELSTDLEAFLEEVSLSGDASVTEIRIDDLAVVQKIDGRRAIELRAKLSEENNTGLIIELQEKIQEEFDATALEERGLESDVLGFNSGQESENLESFESTLVAFVAALALMYVLLVLQFGSFLQPVLIFIAIPLSFPALFPGLLYTNNPLSFFTMLGIIGLSGIVVNNSIMLIDYANQAREAGISSRQAIAEAVGRRLRPILVTSITTIAGLYPLAVSDPFWESLAYALIFGVISSAILILLVFPGFYLLIEAIRDFKRGIVNRLSIE